METCLKPDLLEMLGWILQNAQKILRIAGDPKERPALSVANCEHQGGPAADFRTKSAILVRRTSNSVERGS